jgi:hypothetical protein
MKVHNYLTRINDDQWMDLQRVKELDNRSVNSLINDGVIKGLNLLDPVARSDYLSYLLTS